MSGDGPFLARWSRLKREREAIEGAPGEPALPADAGAEPAAEASDAEILEELGLPDPESLSEGDDFSAFMARAVPERIRQRALRRLWTSNPVLANLDELLDYGEDFTDAAMVVADLATAYRVGRGMPTPEPPAEPAQETAAESEEAIPPEEPAEPAAEARAEPPDDPEAPADPGQVAVAAPSQDPAPARPRRMRFTVAGGPERA